MSIAVDFDACILCDRCIRGCSDIRENFVLGRMGKGAPRESRSITTSPWANPPAFPAANAWFPAQRARYE